jgi:malate dehydrogenase (oxaloacetate-decarboxylating)
MEGKAILFKKFAGVDAFPICLATQDTEEIIKTVKYLAPVFGGINLEDISAPRCFEIEKRLRTELDIPVFHDDQHGTAVVVLAGLINAIQLRNLPKEDARIVINGAGAAGTAIARLLLAYGFSDIIVIDRTGIIERNRPGLNSAKQSLAEVTNPHGKTGSLSEALHDAHIFIGVSAANILSPDMIKTMASDPIIFAMANPIPEIMPDLAREAGAFIVATGRSDFPNQVNNVLAFPGIFRGALDSCTRNITDAHLTSAAEKLAMHVKSPSRDNIIPNPLDKTVAKTIASAFNENKCTYKELEPRPAV